MGVGVAHHPFRPVDEYQPRTPLGPDEPPVTGCGDGDLRDERPEELLIGGQLHQDPSYLVHVGDLAGTQLLQLSREVAEWPCQVAGTHLPTPRSLRSAEPTGCRAGAACWMPGCGLTGTAFGTAAAMAASREE